jgi:hypothetical protein
VGHCGRRRPPRARAIAILTTPSSAGRRVRFVPGPTERRRYNATVIWTRAPAGSARVARHRRAHSRVAIRDNRARPLIRDFITLALGDDGYTVRGAENGAAALDVIRVDTFAVILLDIQMPVMDGLEFVRTRLFRGTRHNS